MPRRTEHAAAYLLLGCTHMPDTSTKRSTVPAALAAAAAFATPCNAAQKDYGLCTVWQQELQQAAG
jgi:hypothetical protein